jgi:hypothetical protein
MKSGEFHSEGDMPQRAKRELEEAKTALRDLALDFEAAKASGDEAQIEEARRSMGEAFGKLVEKKQKTRITPGSL